MTTTPPPHHPGYMITRDGTRICIGGTHDAPVLFASRADNPEPANTSNRFIVSRDDLSNLVDLVTHWLACPDPEAIADEPPSQDPPTLLAFRPQPSPHLIRLLCSLVDRASTGELRGVHVGATLQGGIVQVYSQGEWSSPAEEVGLATMLSANVCSSVLERKTSVVI